MTSRLFIAEAMLKTKELNRNVLTPMATGPLVSSDESWSIEAVTPERNVAMVVKSRYREVFIPCDDEMTGTPKVDTLDFR